MKKIIIILLSLFCLTSCKNDNYFNVSGYDFHFSVDEENEKYLLADIYPTRVEVEITFDYPSYSEFVIPEGATEKEIELLKLDYNYKAGLYYRENNYNYLELLGINDFHVVDIDTSSDNQKVTRTYDLNYYNKEVKTFIKKIENYDYVLNVNVKNINHYNFVTRINSSFYDLQKKDKVKFKNIVSCSYLGDETDNFGFLPAGIYYSKEEYVNALISEGASESSLRYYEKQIERVDFNKSVLYITKPIFFENPRLSRVTDIYIKDNILYTLFQVCEPNSSSSYTKYEQEIISINKKYLDQKTSYKIIGIY